MTDNPPPMPGMFGVYLQVADLDRSLWLYRDVLALNVDWNDGALAVLHGPVRPGNTVVIREIGEKARHDLGEAGVTRLFWQVSDSADLDRAEVLLTRQQAPTSATATQTSTASACAIPTGSRSSLCASARMSAPEHRRHGSSGTTEAQFALAESRVPSAAGCRSGRFGVVAWSAGSRRDDRASARLALDNFEQVTDAAPLLAETTARRPRTPLRDAGPPLP